MDKGDQKKGISLGPVMTSVILPGMGQFALGKRGLGIMFMIGSLGSFAVALYFFITGYIGYFDLAINIDPNAAPPDIREIMNLREIIIFVVSAVALHLASIIHAVVSSSRSSEED